MIATLKTNWLEQRRATLAKKKAKDLSSGGPPFEIPDEWLDRLGHSARKLSCPRSLEPR